MKKTKLLLLIALSFLLIGSIIFTAIMFSLNWDFKELTTMKYVNNNYTIDSEYNNFDISTKTADIIFEISNDDTTKVTCYEMAKATHIVTVENDTLTIKLDDQRKWYNHIDIGFASPKITISLPQAEYSKLKIECKTGDVILPNNLTFTDVNITNKTGDIKLKNITALDMTLSVSTGDIELLNVKCNSLSASGNTGDIDLSNVNCTNLTATASTGDIELENVIATNNFNLAVSTGDIEFDSCDANEITATTTTGSIKGTLLSDKSFDADSKTGKVKVPETTTGGKCKLTTKTGNINITIK